MVHLNSDLETFLGVNPHLASVSKMQSFLLVVNYQSNRTIATSCLLSTLYKYTKSPKQNNKTKKAWLGGE